MVQFVIESGSDSSSTTVQKKQFRHAQAELYYSTVALL